MTADALHELAQAGWSDGRTFPKNDNGVLQAAQQVVSALCECSDLTLFTHDSDFRAGFASYVHLLCFQSESEPDVSAPGVRQLDAIGIYLCGWAPVAVLGPSGIRAFVFATPPEMSVVEFAADSAGATPSGVDAQIVSVIRSALEGFGWVMMDATAARTPLRFKMVHSPATAGCPATLFDAFFFQDD